MTKIVNGFPCTTGCDERVAKQGIDPRNPHNDPVKQRQLDLLDPAKADKIAKEDAQRTGNPSGGFSVTAVVFGGNLAPSAGGDGASAVAASGSTGAVIDRYA